MQVLGQVNGANVPAGHAAYTTRRARHVGIATGSQYESTGDRAVLTRVALGEIGQQREGRLRWH